MKDFNPETQVIVEKGWFYGLLAQSKRVQERKAEDPMFFVEAGALLGYIESAKFIIKEE